MIRVLVCDDHCIVRQGIRQVLADAPDIELAPRPRTAPRRCAWCARTPPATAIDVVLMDIAMPHRDGLDVLRQLRSEFPKLPVLMLSTYPDKQYAVRSMKLGAAGYLNKSIDSEQMIAGDPQGGRPAALFITPSVAEQLASAIGAAAAERTKPAHERAVAPRVPGLPAARRRPQRGRDRARSCRCRPTPSAPTARASSKRPVRATMSSWRCTRSSRS